jgi:hypothetical protein
VLSAGEDCETLSALVELLAYYVQLSS